MIALVLSVQLYIGGPIIRWRVPSCEPAMSQWLDGAEEWAAKSHVPFTGAVSCGLGNAPPDGFAEVVSTEEKPYLLPLAGRLK